MSLLTGLLRSGARLLRRSQADHWSFLFSQIAVYSFVVAFVTGVFLVVFFKPGMTGVTYHGSYHELNGVQMSQAYKSTLDISFDVRGGLLMRQIHHWAALIFVAAVCLQLLRLFFTGAFRRPRGLNWLIWVTPAATGHGGGVDRHDPAGRHDVGRQPGRAPGCARVDPGGRHPSDALDLRGRRPRPSHHSPPLLAARAAAGRHGRPVRPAAPAGAAARAHPLRRPGGLRPAWIPPERPGGRRDGDVLRHLRGARPARRARADQPGLAVRALPAG